jgi:biopolymer transport protein TolQ
MMERQNDGRGPPPAGKWPEIDSPNLLWHPQPLAQLKEVALILAVLAQAQPTAFTSGVPGLIAHSGLVARFVLLLLLAFSLISWAIILYKGVALHRAHAHSTTFLDIFRKSSKFSEVNSVCPQLRASPLVGVFQAGYLEVNQQVRGGHAASPAAKPTVRSLESLSRSLARAATVETTRIERRLSFLATTASVAPFIGLFGTVWGIMDAFREIGATGSSSIVIVAPGISEALITTAMGLLAAIPAAVFFNFFSSRARVLASMMDDFALEFLNIVERNFT